MDGDLLLQFLVVWFQFSFLIIAICWIMGVLTGFWARSWGQNSYRVSNLLNRQITKTNIVLLPSELVPLTALLYTMYTV
jgi:hypothetical protein